MPFPGQEAPATFLPGVGSGGGQWRTRGPWDSTEHLSHTHLGDRPSPGLTLGVTFAKKGLFSWGVEGRWPARICRADLPQLPQTCLPAPPHTGLAKQKSKQAEKPVV